MKEMGDQAEKYTIVTFAFLGISTILYSLIQIFNVYYRIAEESYKEGIEWSIPTIEWLKGNS